MMHVAYPNVERIASDQPYTFRACVRYLSLPEAPGPPYRPARPETGDNAAIRRATRRLVPEWQTQGFTVDVYEKADGPGLWRGPSLGLAYLLARIHCARRLVLEDVVETGDVWCTGTITYLDGEPFLKEVSQTEFEAKLIGFVTQAPDRIFLVPEANVHPEHNRLCRAHAVQILSLAEFQERISATLAAGPWSEQVIVTINGDELPLLVDVVFERPWASAGAEPGYDPEQSRSLQIELDRQRQELSQDRGHRLEVKREAIVGLRFAEVTDFFKDREDKIAELRRLLANRTIKLICIVGRGGIGKTALLSKICAEIESGELSLSNSTVQAGVDGMLYISCRGTDKPTVGRLFDHEVGVGRWLGSPHAEELMDCWRDSSRSLADKTRFLLSKLRAGCYLLVLDNVEDALAPDNTLADPALRTFVELCLATPHALRLIATSRAQVVVDGQVVRAVRTVPLDAGLPDAEAIALLRDLDPEGELGLRDAPDELLHDAVRRCYGVPRALETVAGILSADPTLTFTQLLAEADLFNEQVVENLIAEHHRRVSDEQRRVLEALAIYNKPVPAAAVRYQLASFSPDIDVDSCLRNLVRNYFVTHQRGRATYELHPLDQQHVYARIPDEGSLYTKSACHRRAAEFYAKSRKPRAEWRAITDLQPQREEIPHLMAAKEYEAACALLADIEEYLMSWGYYTEVYQLRSQLILKLSDHGEAANATALAECLYQGLDEWDNALQHVQRVEDSYKRHLNELALAEAVQIHAHILFERGQFEGAFEMAQENLQRYVRSGTPAQVANACNSLGVFVDAVGRWQEAVEYYGKAQTLFEDIGTDPEVGRVLINRSVAEFFLHGAARAFEVCRRGLAFCSQQERPQEFAYGMLNMAVYHLAAAQLEETQSALAQCAHWAAREAWFLLGLKENQSTLYRFQQRYPEALVLLDEVLGPFQDLEDNWGEIDNSINRGCLFRDLGRNHEAMEAWEKALCTAQTKNYIIGTRMSAYLLSVNNRADTLPADVAEWSRAFERDLLPHFHSVFMPCYVLLLRAKPSIR